VNVLCADLMEADESVNENEADCTYAIYSQIMNQSVNIFVILFHCTKTVKAVFVSKPGI